MVVRSFWIHNLTLLIFFTHQRNALYSHSSHKNCSLNSTYIPLITFRVQQIVLFCGCFDIHNRVILQYFMNDEKPK